MKVTVRKEHIQNAKAKDSHHCMIADALRECIGGQYILVDVQSIRYSNMSTGQRFIYLTPAIAQNAILRWDRGIEIQPFSFVLSNPQVRTIKSKNARSTESIDKYNAKRRKNRLAPRLVKKHKNKVSRFREFGIRKFERA